MSLTKDYWETNDNTNDLMSEEEASRIMSEASEPSEDSVAEQDYSALPASIDSFEEDLNEEEEDRELFTNARLRLEQGRLYEMLLRHDLFGDVESDPRAVKNVEREIKTFIKERLEVLLGLKPDPRLVLVQANEGGVQQFTALEVDLLKKLLSKATGGMTNNDRAQTKPTSTKSNTLAKVGGQSPSVKQPIQKVSSPPPKPLQTKAPQQAAIRQSAPASKAKAKEPEPLTKPIHEMTREELLARDKITSERIKAKTAPKPDNAVPMPTVDQQTAMYMARFTNDSNPIAKALMAHIKPSMMSVVSQED